ncbi:MAG: hypothetical protein BV459_07335 [Thermoplasmata archaeon M11B2D]|nr:MAG: hypothetical protein BV459_07335 [Thermoplasmata archaeon M11B2D]
MAKLKASAAKKNRHNVYKTANVASKNKAKKLKRHLKQNPNDAVAKSALDNPKPYAKKKPKTHKWTAPLSAFFAEYARVCRALNADAYASGTFKEKAVPYFPKPEEKKKRTD